MKYLITLFYLNDIISFQFLYKEFFMKKTLFFSLFVSGLLFAQNNNISGNSISASNGNVIINQSNS